MNRRGKIIRSSRLFSLGLPVENPGEGTKKREKGSWRWQEMGGKKEGDAGKGWRAKRGQKKKKKGERRGRGVEEGEAK